MSNFVQMCFMYLYQKRKSMYSTITAIAIGVALVVAVSFIGEIGTDVITAEINSFGIGSIMLSVNKDYSSLQLSEDKLCYIRGLDNVAEAVPVLMEYSKANMKGLTSPVAIWGIEGDNKSQIISLQAIHGRLIIQEDIIQQNMVCLVDENMAEAFYSRSNVVGKKVELIMGNSAQECEIIGVVKSGGNIMQNMFSGYMPFFAYVPYTVLQNSGDKRGFDQIAITLTQQDSTDELGEEIVKKISNEYGEQEQGYKSDNMFAQKEKLSKLIEILGALLVIISAISLLVSGLGIMTVMSSSVTERTREIGIKKALGAKDRLIMYEFLIEGCILSFSGSVVGCIIGGGAVLIGCALLGIEYAANISTVLCCVFVSTALGAIFSAKPALKAAGLTPVEALAQE